VQVFGMSEIVTKGRITALLGKYQMTTGERMSLRRLADLAQVPKDFVYRLDAGQARYVELDALARLCIALRCRLQDILVWRNDDRNDPSTGPRAEGSGQRESV
jgi:DNA-binding Xre family transcriptional regulator